MSSALNHRVPDFILENLTCSSLSVRPNRYRFKAQELNHRILEGGPLLPKKPQVKELTKPIGFNLEIEKRIQERETKKVQEEEHFEFHSRPCPTRILEDVVVIKMLLKPTPAFCMSLMCLLYKLYAVFPQK